MAPFALRRRTLNATAPGDESGFRQETGPPPPDLICGFVFTVDPGAVLM